MATLDRDAIKTRVQSAMDLQDASFVLGLDDAGHQALWWGSPDEKTLIAAWALGRFSSRVALAIIRERSVFRDWIGDFAAESGIQAACAHFEMSSRGIESCIKNRGGGVITRLQPGLTRCAQMAATLEGAPDAPSFEDLPNFYAVSRPHWLDSDDDADSCDGDAHESCPEDEDEESIAQEPKALKDPFPVHYERGEIEEWRETIREAVDLGLIDTRNEDERRRACALWEALTTKLCGGYHPLAEETER